MLREMQFRDQVFAETMMTNKSLVASMQQTNQMTLECIQTITGMMGPLLKATEKENKKLKRMLSERHGISDDNILEAEVSVRKFGKTKEKSDNEQEEFNEVLSQKSEKKQKKTFKPAGKTFQPKDLKPNFKSVNTPEKPIIPEKINLNFKRKKVQEEAPSYTLKPNQKPFKVPEPKAKDETTKDTEMETEEQVPPPPEEDDGSCGFKIGKGKKFEVKIDADKQKNLMARFCQDDNEDPEAFLDSLKANKSKGDIKSFDELA